MPLRRGRCRSCYNIWVRARPVGQGACCAACDNRRHSHLRHFEVGGAVNHPGGRWMILCHNCAAEAEKFDPSPRSTEGVRMRLQRDRRWGDRRAASVGGSTARAVGVERRSADRRDGWRDLFDASEMAEELVIELEADYEDPNAIATETLPPEAITGVFLRVELAGT